MSYGPATGKSKGKGKSAYEVDVESDQWEDEGEETEEATEEEDPDMGGGQIGEVVSWSRVVKGVKRATVQHAPKAKNKCNN